MDPSGVKTTNEEKILKWGAKFQVKNETPSGERDSVTYVLTSPLLTTRT